MKRLFRNLAGILLFLTLQLSLIIPAWAQSDQPVAVLMTADGPLTPVMVGYLERGLQGAQTVHASLVIVQLNTPGGEIDLMDQIVTLFRSSPIPVVVYVAPRGAIAGSAGTIITLAGHLSAMAPETSIGAASPIDQSGQDLSQTLDKKIKEMLKSEARSLTEGRPAAAVQLAQDAIDNATAATVKEALSAGLIDIQANDVNDLLAQLNGRKAKLASGEVVLNTQNMRVDEYAYTFIEQALQVIVDPNLVFLLLSAGIWAILIEISSPGGWIAGFIGAVLILLAVYGLGILPVNWFGLLFLVLGFILFIVDVKAPTHGLLTLAGVVSFVAGALILFNSVRTPGYPQVSVPLVIATGGILAVSFFVIVTYALRARRLPVLTGENKVIGKVGKVKTEISRRGQVQVGGELWSAEPAEGEITPIPVGTEVRVIAVSGLTVRVVRQAQN